MTASGLGNAQDNLAPNSEIQSNSGTSDDSDSDVPTTIDPTPALQSIESAIRDLIAEEDIIERKRQSDRESRNLSAQESIAKWAYWMFVATTASVILTFIALIAIIRTLHHTRRAADYTEGMLGEAEKTTKAAKDTVLVTRELGKIQTRAYMLLDAEHNIEDLRVAVDEVSRGMIRFRNYGQSPAYDFRCSISEAKTPWPIPDVAKLDVMPNDRGGVVVGPNSIVTKSFGYEGIGNPIPESDFEQMRAGEIRYILFGTAIYKDIFGDEHRTEFCLAIVPPDNPVTEVGYGIEKAHRHNNAD